MAEEAAADKLRQSGIKAKIAGGEQAVLEAAAYEGADIIVNGISGFSGMKPLLGSAGSGQNRCPCKQRKHRLCSRPGKCRAEKGRCHNTGGQRTERHIPVHGGGKPRRDTKAHTYGLRRSLQGIYKGTAQNRHAGAGRASPNLENGQKDHYRLCLLFNKGLEIMEASYLFGIPGERISVLVHPESIVHSMVEYTDGCNMAQLSRPDMRLAIQYALTYPERTPGEFGRLRLEDMGKISFYAPDTDKFPAIPMAYEALREGGALPIVYNGANEAAVDMFIRGKIRFDEIADVVGYAMSRADRGNILSLEDIIKTDRQARRLAFEKGNA